MFQDVMPNAVWQSYPTHSHLHENLTFNIISAVGDQCTVCEFGCSCLGYKTVCVTFRYGRGLKVFEDRVLTEMFETEREAVSGGWREMQNEGHLDLYYYL